MVEKENHCVNEIDETYYQVALVLSGKVKREDLSPNNITVFEYWSGVMIDDPKVRGQINNLVNKIKGDGIKAPLFNSTDLQNAREHERPVKKKPSHAYPKPFWPYGEENAKPVQIELINDPERNLNKIEKLMDNRFDHHLNTPMNEEARKKRMELREKIGLPIASGKDAHVNDKYYKFLVRHIYNFDTFHIFTEYVRELADTPEWLESKIEKVAGLINELLNGGLNRKERNNKYNEFLELHREEWNIVDYRR